MSRRKSKKEPDTKPLRKRITVAPGQALGYGLQYTRLTSLLLDASEGTSCTFEVLDDVAQQDATGKVTLTQTKSALSGNPASDRSLELWKSLWNWKNGIQEGLINPETTKFVLYISKKVSGKLVEAFSKATTMNEARAAVQLAKDELWGTPPDNLLKGKLPAGLGKYVNPVLEAKETWLFPFVINLSLECGSGSPLEDLREKIKKMPVSPESVNVILDHVCGWVKVEVDKLLEDKKPAVISRDRFFVEFRSFVRKIEKEEILRNFAPEPNMKDKRSQLPRIYVQQLDLIGLSFDEKLEAITDFLRASRNRTVWAQRGDVHESSYDELDSNLKRSWRNMRRRIDAETKQGAEIDLGRVLYSECMEHKTLIEGMHPPDHFVPGCFHRLSDEQEVGWHPKYREILGAAVRKKSA